MRPGNSEIEFRQFIKSAGKSLEAVSGADAVRLALDFYSQVRCEDCDLDNSGDMLLYQWSYSKLHNKFCFDITRQFILKGSMDDGGMSQLCFTLNFPASEKLAAIERGDLWCKSPAQLNTFEEFILNSEAYKEVMNLVTDDIDLYWCGV